MTIRPLIITGGANGVDVSVMALALQREFRIHCYISLCQMLANTINTTQEGGDPGLCKLTWKIARDCDEARIPLHMSCEPHYRDIPLTDNQLSTDVSQSPIRQRKRCFKPAVTRMLHSLHFSPIHNNLSCETMLLSNTRMSCMLSLGPYKRWGVTNQLLREVQGGAWISRDTTWHDFGVLPHFRLRCQQLHSDQPIAPGRKSSGRSVFGSGYGWIYFQGNYRLKQPPRSIIRELGWCDWRAENCRSFLYLPLESYGKLSDDDRRTHVGKDHRTPFVHPSSRKCQIAYRVQWKPIWLPCTKNTQAVWEDWWATRVVIWKYTFWMSYGFHVWSYASVTQCKLLRTPLPESGMLSFCAMDATDDRFNFWFAFDNMERVHRLGFWLSI